MRNRAARLLLLLVLLSAGPAAAQDWQLFLDQDGVRGYTRQVPGSGILELRSTIVVPARIEVVGTMLRDVEGLAKPGSSCREARYLERPDRDRYTFYVAYDFPWPASDRDAVIEVRNRYDLDRARVISDLRGVEHKGMPRRQDHVRITKLRSQFIVQYISRHKTGIIYTSRADPAGHLPDWLINRGARNSLHESALDLRRAARKPEYLKAASTSPDARLVERLTRDPSWKTRVVAYRLGEFIGDRALIARLVGEPRVVEALIGERGNIGEVLLHGFGSRKSHRQAVELLLRALLAAHTRDRAAVDRFVTDRSLIDAILLGRGGDRRVQAFLVTQKRAGPAAAPSSGR